MTTTRLNSTATIGATAHGNPAVRHETEDGTDYLVANTVAIKEGVYAYPTPDGQIVREYLSEDELTKSASDWHERQVVLPTHPLDEDGNPTTFSRGNVATAPPTVGETRHPLISYDADGKAKLQFETWLDLSNEGEHDGAFDSVVSRLESGETVENSTGYDAGSRANAGNFKGENYQREQTDLSPDHHAILLNETGNCSVSGGCGVGRLNSSPSAQYHVMTNPDDTADTEDLSDEAAASLGRRFLNTMPSLLGGSADEECECGGHTATTNSDPSDEESESESDEDSEDDDEGEDDPDTPESTETMEDDLINTLAESDDVPFSEDTLSNMSEDELTTVQDTYVEADTESESTEASTEEQTETEAETETAETETDFEEETVEVSREEFDQLKAKVEAPEQETIAEAEKAVANSQGISEDAVSISSAEEAKKILASQRTEQGYQQAQRGNMVGVPQQTSRANTSTEDVEFPDYSTHQQED